MNGNAVIKLMFFLDHAITNQKLEPRDLGWGEISPWDGREELALTEPLCRWEKRFL